jgi:tRNA pseudouridine32 synthase/23S rRNA pseudouridine746 synthase
MSEHTLSFEKHLIIETHDQTAIQILSDNCPQVSKQKLKQAMQYGAVWLTRATKTTRLRRAKKVLVVGEELHLYYDEEILFSDITPAQLVADENEYSVWNKPVGMFSQGTKWADHSSIARWVELFGFKNNKLKERPVFLVHRLDRATSGLIMVAHSKNATKHLTQLFEHRKIIKQYLAVVKGDFPKALVLKELNEDIDEKKALSIVKSSVYDEVTNQSSLMVEIKTGRKHQIRKHLLGLGFPVIGDRLYGNQEKEEGFESDLMLKSCLLKFKDPFDEELKVFCLNLSY